MDTFSASFSFVLSLVLMVTMGFNNIKFENKRTDYFTYGRGIPVSYTHLTLPTNREV